jgi:hypothetical protein
MVKLQMCVTSQLVDELIINHLKNKFIEIVRS